MNKNKLIILLSLLCVFLMCSSVYIATLFIPNNLQTASSNEALISLYGIGGAIIGYLAKSLEST